MEFVLQWVKNIAVYLVLISVVLNILPGSSYKKYVRLFTGFLLAILVAKPLLQLFNLDTVVKNYYEYYGELSGADTDSFAVSKVQEEQKQAVIAAYEAQVEQDVSQLAKEKGWVVKQLQISLESGEEEFGRIVSITVSVEDAAEDVGILIAPVVIGEGETIPSKNTQGLKSEIAKKYQLEEEQVQVN